LSFFVREVNVLGCLFVFEMDKLVVPVLPIELVQQIPHIFLTIVPAYVRYAVFIYHPIKNPVLEHSLIVKRMHESAPG
jgi:hypothetical protein